MQTRHAMFTSLYSKRHCAIFTATLCLAIFSASTVVAQVPLLGMGDSIGEGVQSADANWRTQLFTYLNWVGRKLEAPFPLPLIQSGPLGMVGDTQRRFRINPTTSALNLSVSGADVNSLLNDRADAGSVLEIDSETDLVLFPRLGSQIEIAESLPSQLVICWIGNNDALSAALSWDQLDGSQTTSLEDFSNRYHEIAQRLGALQTDVVLANIPDVTSIGFLLDRQDLIRFLGSDFGLAQGDFTTIPTMLIIKLGLNNGSLLQNPDFVLDANEVELIQQRIEAFNGIIDQAGAGIGAAVVDMNAVFREIVANPPTILGVPITHRFLGGMFSLDGVHPSNIGHAFVADIVIKTINSHFNSQIPELTQTELLQVFLTDPFVDKDGDGRVRGRFGAGLLETLGPFLGISGDQNDFIPDARTVAGSLSSGERFIRRYRELQGGSSTTSVENLQEVVDAFKHIFLLRPDF